MILQKPNANPLRANQSAFIAAYRAEYDAALTNPALQSALNVKFQEWKVAEEKNIEAELVALGKANWQAFEKDPQAILNDLKEEGGRSSEPGEIAVYCRLASIKKLTWAKEAGRQFPKGCDYKGTVASKGFNVTFELGNGEVIKAAGTAFYSRNDQQRSACALIYQHLCKLAGEKT